MLNIHSHKHFGKEVIHNISPKEWDLFSERYPQQRFSVGIHPWHVQQKYLEEELALLSDIVAHKQVFAVGETGLDKHCGVSLDLQMKSLETHIELSEKNAKPLILHCVAAYNELQLLKRRLQPTQRWILHGFRGNRILAQQLLSDGFYFSIGWNFNVETIKMLPDDKLYFETDEADVSVEEVYAKAMTCRK